MQVLADAIRTAHLIAWPWRRFEQRAIEPVSAPVQPEPPAGFLEPLEQQVRIDAGAALAHAEGRVVNLAAAGSLDRVHHVIGLERRMGVEPFAEQALDLQR